MTELDERLRALRGRISGVDLPPWVLDTDTAGTRLILTGRTEGENRLYVELDVDAAGEDDMAFIALARNVLERLAEAVERDPHLISPQELDEIEAVTARASTRPWIAFLEDRQPIGGSSVIWVGGEEAGADMYLWYGNDMAPSSYFDFVAHARDDVPDLVAALRRAQEAQ